jgi:hypothetical protein
MAKKANPGVHERTARAIRLKGELQTMLELVVNVRERLENELAGAGQEKFINREFVSKLKDLASMFERLSNAHIQLLKTEKMLEDAMSPEQERQAVRNFLDAMSLTECADFIFRLTEDYRLRGGRANISAQH